MTYRAQLIIFAIFFLVFGSSYFFFARLDPALQFKLGKEDGLIETLGAGFFLVTSVVFFSTLKYLTNIIQTIIAQRATGKMRKELYHHILTLPLGFFRNTQPGSVVNSLVGELAMPGNFVGMAVSAPVTNVLTLLAFAVYLFWLNPLLAQTSDLGY